MAPPAPPDPLTQALARLLRAAGASEGRTLIDEGHEDRDRDPLAATGAARDALFEVHVKAQQLAAGHAEAIRERRILVAPQCARPKLLAALDKRIAQIEEQHNGIVDAAAALDPPIVLESLQVARPEAASTGPVSA